MIDEKILSMQAPSTRAALLRKGDYDPNANWPPKNWMAVPDALSIDEMVACRPFTYEEVKIEQDLRGKRGLIIADLREEKSASSVTPKKKEAAVEAFMNVTTIEKMKQKFKELMGSVKKSYHEMVAENMTTIIRNFHEK